MSRGGAIAPSPIAGYVPGSMWKVYFQLFPIINTSCILYNI